MTHLHIDATIGCAGDMLLAALIDAGASLTSVQEAIDATLPGVRLTVGRTQRAAVAATHVMIESDDTTERSWADIRPLLSDPLALTAFERLAEVEATIHGVEPDQVHFHEVGAVDSIADIVGVAAAVQDLGITSCSATEIGVGRGTVRTRHGVLPVPAPAVALLLREIPTWAGPLPVEACTPTAAALLTALATSFGGQPPMTTSAVGVGAGTYEDPDAANVTRVFLGTSAPWLLETNVDDLDPRLWPTVLAELLAAGASDAWLTPILMKKGRPAHTLSVLVSAGRMPDLRRAIAKHTSAIGLRQQQIGKWALDRRMESVEVLGHPIAVKVASEDGQVLNVQPEWEDVRKVAEQTGRPPHEVLQRAIAAAQIYW